MSEIVCTQLDGIEELDSAIWKVPGQPTYDSAKSQLNPKRGISVVGQRDKSGRVSPCMVRCYCSNK